MGIININCRGSFRPMQGNFYAQTSGHAVAVEDAIAWLKDRVLPAAKKQDADLRKEGHAPDDGFAEFDKRHATTGKGKS